MTAARALLVLLLLQLIGCSSPPDDQVLIEIFTKERASFERLVEIVAQEQSHTSMVLVGTYFDENDSTKTMHRIMEPDPYQLPDPRDSKVRAEKTAIIRKLHISHMFPYNHRVTFWATGMEDVFSGFSKGWEFVNESGPRPDSSSVVRSLDGIEGQMEPYDVRYRSLGDGWYLFLMSNSD